MALRTRGDWQTFLSSSFERQQTPFDCGRVALASIARIHGIDCSSLRLVDGTKAMSLFELCRVAESLGLAAEAVRVRPRRVRQLEFRLPCVLLCKSTAQQQASTSFHYFVLLSIDSREAAVLDPNHGVYALSLTRLARLWTGIAVFFETSRLSSRHPVRRRNDRERRVKGTRLESRVAN